MSFAPVWGRDRETSRRGWSRDDRNRTYGLHSGSRIVCLATAWKRPERSGAVSQHDGFVLLNRKSTRRSVGQRTRPLLSRKRTGRDSNPLDLSVICHVLRTGSRVCFDVLCSVEVVMQKRDRRSCDQRVLRRSTTELRPCVSERQLGRWDSNPRHPAPEACTPNRQSIVCVVLFLFLLQCLPHLLPHRAAVVRSSRTNCCCRVSMTMTPPLGRLT